MKVCEIFTAIQGESTHAGRLCTFVRLSGCNLRCSYCDTQYAFENGRDLALQNIIDDIVAANVHLVELTGGEPLLQKQEVDVLTKALLDSGYEVLIETNGSVPINDIDKRAKIILDIKTPGSGMHQKMQFSNIEHIKPADEIKFVLCSRKDYDWAKDIALNYGIIGRCEILMSPAYGILNPRDLAGWIIADRLQVRLNLQLHKYIYGHEERMV